MATCCEKGEDLAGCDRLPEGYELCVMCQGTGWQRRPSILLYVLTGKTSQICPRCVGTGRVQRPLEVRP
jgi:DnaJ-class molecular chaperone